MHHHCPEVLSVPLSSMPDTRFNLCSLCKLPRDITGGLIPHPPISLTLGNILSRNGQVCTKDKGFCPQ